MGCNPAWGGCAIFFLKNFGILKQVNVGVGGLMVMDPGVKKCTLVAQDHSRSFKEDKKEISFCSSCKSVDFCLFQT